MLLFDLRSDSRFVKSNQFFDSKHLVVGLLVVECHNFEVVVSRVGSLGALVTNG